MVNFFSIINKKNFNNIILLLIITITCGFNIYLFSLINKEIRQKNKKYVTKLDKNNYILGIQNNLKYFYEHKPNTVMKDENIPWLKDKIPVHSINSDGLNSEREYSLQKPKNVYRIAAIGDSFTHGAFVNTADSYPAKLEKMLNQNIHCPNGKKFEVLNFGIPGYDFEYTVERYSLRGTKYSPDLILLLMQDDDFQAINEFIIPREKELEIKYEIDRTSINYYFDGNKVYPLWQKASQELWESWGEEKILQYQKNLLNKMLRYYNGKILFFAFPSMQNRYKKLLQDFLKVNKNLYFYDNLVDIYRKREYLPDEHPNEKGYELIAEDVYHYLINNKLISCKL